MRVTNTMMAEGFITDLSLNMKHLQKINQQLDSGKEIRKPSDDPFKVARSMQLHTDINTNKQFNENIKDTKNWLEETDTALGQVGDQVKRVRELLITAGNGAYSLSDRKKIKDEINEIVGQIAQTLNSSFDGKYLFGGTRVTKKPLTTEKGKGANGNTFLRYAGEEGEILPDQIKTKINDVNDWKGNITFTCTTKDQSGKEITKDVSINLAGANNESDLEKKINEAINKNSLLKGKLKAVANNGNLNFVLTDASVDIKIGKNNTIPEMKTLAGKKVDNYANNQMDMICDTLITEISQGVKIEYNITATQILQFEDKDGNAKDVRDILKDIVTHLDSDKDEEVRKLDNEDLVALDAFMDNILKLRSEVGAKANRMESALEKNKSENFDLTEILSKTEDVDFAKKSMEQSIAMTVYQAALQTSARVLLPTLMDFLR